MSSRRSLEFTMWAGVLGAPAVWACQHVFGFGVTQAACSPAGRMWDVPVDTWTAIATAVAAVFALAALAASIVTFRAVRSVGEDGPPPDGRIYFMSICGIVITPLFLAIILMSGIGTLILPHCRQG